MMDLDKITMVQATFVWNFETLYLRAQRELSAQIFVGFGSGKVFLVSVIAECYPYYIEYYKYHQVCAHP